ncbi:hypothetical protein BLNAU_14346 [Blattamonas nauphoetae]|uniref:Uncharacterized protein n=1 Tax=Blattamonas nauphoetae TaxID=2049346 RepID=A0ABQ9XGY6_9EUKA|nr:hypothetical protein BLNAU_14346 [Blattamonas nauphoetae]
MADLIPQLINTLNPLSLSFVTAENIHMCLIYCITCFLWLATPPGLEDLGIEDHDGQLAVHETVLKQVLIPSEEYIWHLCLNRLSIVDGLLSMRFMSLLAQLLRISSYYQPTMDFVLRIPLLGIEIGPCCPSQEDDNTNKSLATLLPPPASSRHIQNVL